MCKSKKGKKISNRIRKVSEKTLFKLYNNLPFRCQSCCYNANCDYMEHFMDDTMDCDNHERAFELNELIEMIKEQNINLEAFCDKYNLKIEFLKEMLRGKMLFNYKYYVSLLTRLHIKGFDEFDKYENNFKTSDEESEVV